MFPRGVNPDDVRRMQEQTDLARRYYEPMAEILRRADPRLHAANVVQLDAERQRAMLSAEAMRASAMAEQALNSTGLRSAWEAMRRANELAEARFGSGGMDAALRIVGPRLEPDPSFAEGFERAEEKIREGRANEVLDEAAAVVSSEETRRTLESADEEALFDAARRQAVAEDEAPALEIRAGVDVETVIALAYLSDEELDAVLYCAGQTIKVLVFAVSAALVVASPPLSLAQASYTLGAAMALWAVVDAARARKKERKKDS